MKVLVGCETTGTVRDAFIKKGHYAISCDLLASESNYGPHYQGDILDLLNEDFDLFIVHPDCTYLTASAAWAFGDGPYHQKVKPETLTGLARRLARDDALKFVEKLAACKIPKIAIENPATGFLNTMLDLTQYGFRTNFPTQVIQPYQYGHDASKATGLALKGLPDLTPTNHVWPRMVQREGKKALPRWGNQTDSGQNKLTPGPMRWLDRARTYQGWANAMAEQWGEV